MERTHFITHRGKQILVLNYSGLEETPETLVEIEKSREIVAREPPQSVLTLTYVRDAKYDGRVIQALKELAAHNKPFVRAGAVVGMSLLHRVVYQLVIFATKRKLATFEDLQDAKDWLVEQP